MLSYLACSAPRCGYWWEVHRHRRRWWQLRRQPTVYYGPRWPDGGGYPRWMSWDTLMDSYADCAEHLVATDERPAP